MRNSNHRDGFMRRIAMGTRLGRAVTPLAVIAVLAMGGCDVDRLLDVENPTRIPAEGLTDPENAQLLVNGAVGDFECAYNAYVALSAVLAGEMTDATQTADRWPYDRRAVQSDDRRYATFGCTALGVYTPLATARWSADNILEALQGWTDAEVPGDRQGLIAEAAAYSGYSHLLLGEGFCSSAIDLSTELSSEDMFQLAVDRFTTAIGAAQSAGEGDLLNLALVGRARAHLALGNGAEAVADASLVPEDFVYEVTASTAAPRRNNRVFEQSGVGATGGDALSVGEQYRDVEWMGVDDPRVPVVDEDRTATEGTPIFLQTKYNSLSDPLPLATGTEAQLIIAEVQGGQTAVDIINALHAAAGLPAFESESESEIEAHVLQERARELWLTGHRFFDIRRHALPLQPAPGTDYRKGGVYGDTRCFPLPDVEVRNNPNI